MAQKPYVIARASVPPSVRLGVLQYMVDNTTHELVVDNDALMKSRQSIRFSATTKDLLRGLGKELETELVKSDWAYLVEPIQEIAFLLNSTTWAPFKSPVGGWPGLREWVVRCTGHASVGKRQSEESDLLVFFDWLLERVPSIEHDPFLFALSTDKWRRKSAGTFHRFLTRGNGSLYDAFGEGLEMPHDEPRYVEYAFVAREDHKQGFMLRTEHRDPSVWHLDVTPEVDPATLRRFVAWFQRRLGRVKAMAKFMPSIQK